MSKEEETPRGKTTIAGKRKKRREHEIAAGNIKIG